MSHLHLSNNNGDINKKCCCFNMRKIARAVTQFFDQHLESVGIRSTQFTLLYALYSTQAKTLTEIAENLIMDRTTLTRNLKPLEKQGLITTVQTTDKRSKGYTLTAAGTEVMNRAIPLWEVAQKSMVDSIGEARYKHVIKELEEMIAITTSSRILKRLQ